MLIENVQEKNMQFIALFSLNAFVISLCFLFFPYPSNSVFSQPSNECYAFQKTGFTLILGNFGTFNSIQSSHNKQPVLKKVENLGDLLLVLLSLGWNSISLE